MYISPLRAFIFVLVRRKGTPKTSNLPQISSSSELHGFLVFWGLSLRRTSFYFLVFSCVHAYFWTHIWFYPRINYLNIKWNLSFGGYTLGKQTVVLLSTTQGMLASIRHRTYFRRLGFATGDSNHDGSGKEAAPQTTWPPLPAHLCMQIFSVFICNFSKRIVKRIE